MSKKTINEKTIASIFSSEKNDYDKSKVLLPEEMIKKLTDKVVEESTARKISRDQEIYFYDLEIEFLKSLPDEKIKRLFYSLLCFEKLHWHESGWIRFEIDELAELGGLKTLRCEDFADLVPFGLKMRVTGSKNAVSTYYSIGWMIEKQTNKDRTNTFLSINGLQCTEKFLEVLNWK